MTKYFAKRTTVDNITFASKMEAKRYVELKYLQSSGKISQLVLQEKFPIVVMGKKICTYISDFSYVDVDGDRVVEDVKGFRTPIYRLKRKLVEALYNIKITEV